jgi:hypothetical protein
VRRALLGASLGLALACLAACTTGDPAFPPTGTLSFTLLDSTLAGQAAAEPTNQFVKWDVAAATAEISGVGTVDFLGGTSCSIAQRIGAFANSCDITGLVLEPGTSATANLHFVVTRLEVIRGERPELTPGEDFDGDGIDDLIGEGEDNCPYKANPDQADGNDDGRGDACSISGAPDTDGDGLSDFSDNCVYFVNEQQENTAREDGLSDAVGDACEEQVVVTLPPGGLVIDRPDLAFTISDGRVSIVQVDFKTKDWCDPGGECAIDPAVVDVSVR